MSDFAFEWLLQLFRCAIVLLVAGLLASALLPKTKAKPNTQILAWLLVLLPGWLLLSFTLELPWHAPNPPASSSPGGTIVTSAVPNSEPWPHTDSTQSYIAAASSSVTFATATMAGLASVWVAGMLFLIGQYISRYWRLARTVRSLPLSKNRLWLDAMKVAVQERAISQTPTLVVSATLGPAACLIGRQYYLVLPESAEQNCSATQRAAILHHELAHIQRRDVWLALLGRLLLLPQWFNPMAWHAVKRLDEAIELGCDETVLATAQLDRFDYAKSLLTLVEHHQGSASLPHALATTGPPITKRIQNIVHPKGTEMKFARTLTTFSLIAIAMVAFVRIELVAQTETQKPTDNTQPPIAAVDRTTLDPQKNEIRTDCPLLTTTYYVGDLVLRNPPLGNRKDEPSQQPRLGGVTLKDFEPLTQLIKTTNKGDGWGNKYTTQTYVRTLSLVVSCPKEVHYEIETLLEKLRELDDVSIELQYLLRIVQDSATTDLPQITAAVYDIDFELEQKAIPEKLLDSRIYPVAKVSNGATCWTFPSKLGKAKLHGLEFNVAHSPDASSVTISLKKLSQGEEFDGKNRQTIPPTNSSLPISKNAITTPDNKGETGRKPAWQSEFISAVTIPNKGYAKIDVSKLIATPKKGQKAVLLVRPKIVDRRNKALKH